jgi:hypothetical protein
MARVLALCAAIVGAAVYVSGSVATDHVVKLTTKNYENSVSSDLALVLACYGPASLPSVLADFGFLGSSRCPMDGFGLSRCAIRSICWDLYAFIEEPVKMWADSQLCWVEQYFAPWCGAGPPNLPP